MRIFGLLLLLYGSNALGQSTPTIRSKEINEDDYRFEKTIQDYQNSENWKMWSFPLGITRDEASADNFDSVVKPITSHNDSDLKTALLLTDSIEGYLPKFEFQMAFPEYAFFGSAYQFFGQFNIFNGNCHSLNDWSEYARIKTLNVYLNTVLICQLELSDTWHLQFIDISFLFRCEYLQTNLEAPYEIKEGDVLSFEITAVYPGSKYEAIALSEFLYQGASN